MSYDLFFKTDDEIGHDAFFGYFEDRDSYYLFEDEGRAGYENEDTGVYFGFERHVHDDEEALSFNLNYFRPSFFGLEAAPEITEFVEHFDLGIDDPQRDGMADGRYSEEGFLQAWRAGNRFAVDAILSRHADEVDTFVMAREDLYRIWRWNHNRKARQAKAGDAHFVPRISFCVGSEGRAATYVVWTDACPIEMPEVDWVVVLNYEDGRDRPRPSIATWNEFSPILENFEFRQDHWFLEYDYREPPPRHVYDWFIHQRRSADDVLTGAVLEVDRVLDEELLVEGDE